MKYVTYFKNNLMVDRIYDKKPRAITDDLAIAQCENIITAPQFGYLKVKNLQTVTAQYKEVVEVIDEETQQPIIDEKTGKIKTVEEVKTREYQTCELEAVENPNKEKLLKIQREKDCDNRAVALIRKKYDVNAELKILRKKDIEPDKYEEYYKYVEDCIKQAHQEFGI